MFAVLIRGQNYLINTVRGVERLGFHVTRIIDVETEAEARQLALAGEPRFEEMQQMALNEAHDPPRLGVDDVWRLAEMPPQGSSSFVYYRMDEE